MSTNRIDKNNYYLDIAETVLERATCLRRCYGAVVVNNDQIISTGYNGAPRGRENCTTLGYCAREKLNITQGANYELCRSVHAEQNAIISAGREKTIGGTLYLVGKDAKTGVGLAHIDSCIMCKRVVINSCIKQVVVRDVNSENGYRIIDVKDWIQFDEVLENNVKPLIKGADDGT